MPRLPRRLNPSFRSTCVLQAFFCFMDEKLYIQLKKEVDVSSIEALCRSISAIGPYISTLAIQSDFLSDRLTYFKLASNRRRSYRHFKIPKKSGGCRNILAPKKELKQIQTCLNFILSTIYTPPKEVVGFVLGKSVRDNALCHLNKNYVLNTDLQDFFPSISARMVEQALTRINVDPFVARLIAEVCTIPEDKKASNRCYLPQGAPTSPVLSNIAYKSLDKRLIGLAKRFHVEYTRYADDMTFSSNHNVYQPDGEFMQELQRIIADNNLSLNPNKTRLLKRGTRQEVTGLTVGEKVNVSRTYVKNLRALIHSIAISPMIDNHKLNVAYGKLNYLRMIKGKSDSTYRALCIKLNLALRGKHIQK